MSLSYYNENDNKTAAWLRELIKAGLIANGDKVVSHGSN